MIKRWHWLTWVSGLLLLWALVYQNVVGNSQAWLGSVQIAHHGFGWPVVFFEKSPSRWVDRLFSPPQLVFDLIVCGFILVTTVAAVEQWTRDRIAVPTANYRFLGILLATLVGWYWLSQFLHVPLFVFLGWAALTVIFLAIPCVAYSVVNALPKIRAFRFSVRTLMLFLAVLCLVAAWGAPSRYLQHKKAQAIGVEMTVDPVNYGILQQLNAGYGYSSGYKVVECTNRIPFSMGTTFGVEYTLAARAVGSQATVPAHIFVEKVYYSPKSAKRTSQQLLQPGERDVMVYRVEPNSEPGEWKFEIWADDGQGLGKQRLLQKSFVVGE
jgi:hypothetical protein